MTLTGFSSAPCGLKNQNVWVKEIEVLYPDWFFIRTMRLKKPKRLGKGN